MAAFTIILGNSKTPFSIFFQFISFVEICHVFCFTQFAPIQFKVIKILSFITERLCLCLCENTCKETCLFSLLRLKNVFLSSSSSTSLHFFVCFFVFPLASVIRYRVFLVVYPVIILQNRISYQTLF